MRIALNLHGFLPGCGGVETYVASLLEMLPRVDRENEYLVLCGPSTARWYERTVEERCPVRVSNYEAGSLPSYLRILLQRFPGLDLLERELRSVAVDVMHHPLTILNPGGLHIPAVLTFHDMQHEFFPEFFSPAEMQSRNTKYKPSLVEARAVIAVSAHAKQGLVDHYGIPAEKIHVIHHGYADRYRPVDDPALSEQVRSRYLIDKPFMIYPAATWAHKNHLRLLGALRKLLDEGHFDGELLLTGASNTFHAQVMAEISCLGLEGRVRWLGYVPVEDLPVLYSLARLMVFPSQFEGFGLPLLEAMACGCPVTCSDVTSLPEVAGDAAHFFDPESIPEIAEKVSELWQDESLRDRLREKGFVRAQMFSWERAARQTLKVYRMAADDGDWPV